MTTINPHLVTAEELLDLINILLNCMDFLLKSADYQDDDNLKKQIEISNLINSLINKGLIISGDEAINAINEINETTEVINNLIKQSIEVKNSITVIGSLLNFILSLVNNDIKNIISTAQNLRKALNNR